VAKYFNFIIYTSLGIKRAKFEFYSVQSTRQIYMLLVRKYEKFIEKLTWALALSLLS